MEQKSDTYLILFFLLVSISVFVIYSLGYIPEDKASLFRAISGGSAVVAIFLFIETRKKRKAH